MKYKKELQALLKGVFHEDWMNKEDWSEFERILLDRAKVSYKTLSRDIEKGIENGYPLEVQLTLIRRIFVQFGIDRLPLKKQNS